MDVVSGFVFFLSSLSGGQEGKKRLDALVLGLYTEQFQRVRARERRHV